MYFYLKLLRPLHGPLDGAQPTYLGTVAMVHNIGSTNPDRQTGLINYL